MNSQTRLLTVVLAITALAFIVPVSQASRSLHIEQTKAAELVITIAIMGDSNTDEYRADDNRGGAYAATTLNWAEQLVKYRNIDLGTFANWGGFRRTGYEYNFSRSGATTASALKAGVHKSIAALVEADKVQFVYYALGANDFALDDQTFSQIYSGKLHGNTLDAYSQQVVTNITTALDTVNTSHKAKILVSLIPDITISPAARSHFPDPAKLKAVADVVSKTNDAIREAASKRGYAVFDVNAAGKDLLGLIDLQGNIVIGGEKFSFTASGDEPHHMLVSDGLHVGTVFSGFYANEWIVAANAAFGTQIQPFSDDELLAHAGIKSSTAGATQPSQSILTEAQSLLRKLFAIELP